MNVRRGRKRLLIGVPVLSTFCAFFGGVRLWAMYETAGKVWGASVVFVFLILLVWFFFRTLRWIVEGFDLWGDKWMSLREIEEKRDELMIALYEDDITTRREKLLVVAEGGDPENCRTTRRESWWHRNFPDPAFTQAHSAWPRWRAEYRLYGFLIALIVSGTGVVTGLALLLLGSPPGS